MYVFKLNNFIKYGCQKQENWFLCFLFLFRIYLSIGKNVVNSFG